MRAGAARLPEPRRGIIGSANPCWWHARVISVKRPAWKNLMGTHGQEAMPRAVKRMGTDH